MEGQEENIEKIHQIIRWLETHSRSQDISGFCVSLDELAIASFYLAEAVSEAHTTMNDAEASYKAAMARSVAESKESTAKAERLAEVSHEGLRKEFVSWRNLYSKLRLKMDRIDSVLESHKQRVSFLKQEIKNSPQSV